jgi:hypothetical protein
MNMRFSAHLYQYPVIRGCPLLVFGFMLYRQTHYYPYEGFA